ncbi:MAG: 50S ribosomal protein L21 [Oscillospiraceae bacterium]|jgi:large subunit ribosomal protein L21|nr:50S ribosomal protein L21 [Oscillospiraceae bacterium]
MYAIIKTCGRQYKVTPNDEIFVEWLHQDEGTEVKIQEVLAVNNDKELIFSPEQLTGVSVMAQVLKNGKAKKITVFTYKAKKNQKRKLGHRQLYTKLKIVAINGV